MTYIVSGGAPNFIHSLLMVYVANDDAFVQHQFLSCPSTFFATISRFGERFRDGQQSLASLFAVLLTVHSVKCGGGGAPVSSPLFLSALDD